MRLPNPYSLEETLSKLRHRLATACNEEALALLEKAVTKARDDEGYAKVTVHRDGVDSTNSSGNG